MGAELQLSALCSQMAFAAHADNSFEFKQLICHETYHFTNQKWFA